MGKQIYLADVMELFRKSPVVSFSSIMRIIRDKKEVKQYGKRLVAQLLHKGRIKQLAKGCYTSQDDPSLAVFCFQPAYLGLQDALSAHNLSEQETVPVIITARKVRTGLRKIIGQNALIRGIDKRYYFGLTYIQQDTVALPYSDIEKTLIDMVYFRQPLSREMIAELKKRISRKTMESYISRYSKKMKAKIVKILEW